MNDQPAIDPWLKKSPRYPSLVLIYDRNDLLFARVLMSEDDADALRRDIDAIGDKQLRVWDYTIDFLVDLAEEGHELVIAKKQGASARFNGKPITDNFYREGSMEWRCYNNGWNGTTPWPMPHP